MWWWHSSHDVQLLIYFRTPPRSLHCICWWCVHIESWSLMDHVDNPWPVCVVYVYICVTWMETWCPPSHSQWKKQQMPTCCLLTLLYIYVAFVQCPFTLTFHVPAFLWSIFCPLQFTDRVRVLTVWVCSFCHTIGHTLGGFTLQNI